MSLTYLSCRLDNPNILEKSRLYCSCYAVKLVNSHSSELVDLRMTQGWPSIFEGVFQTLGGYHNEFILRCTFTVAILVFSSATGSKVEEQLFPISLRQGLDSFRS